MVMIDRQAWTYITALGDSAVVLPCAVLIGLWLLILPRTRYLAWRWTMIVLAVVLMVVASKLAFMCWLITLPRLDFTGLSGHTAMAVMIWPAFGALLGGCRNAFAQVAGLVLGSLLALIVGLSRIILHVHSISEVTFGALISGITTFAFLWSHRAVWCLSEKFAVAGLSLLLVMPLVYRYQVPSEILLARAAYYMSGHPAYTRLDLALPQQK